MFVSKPFKGQKCRQQNFCLQILRNVCKLSYYHFRTLNINFNSSFSLGIVNPNGTDCPYALKMLGCLVLQEITTFLRETFQDLPRSKKQKSEAGWDKHLSARRWSSIVSSPGHSEKSSESNIAELPQSSPGKFVI